MKFQLAPHHWLIICKILGFGLLFLFSIEVREQIGFFLLLLLIALFILRQRVKKTEFTIYLDCLMCIFMMNHWEYASYALLVVLFEALTRKKYLALLTVIYLYTHPELLLFVFLASLAGYFLGSWIEEKEKDLARRFELRGQIYELESLTETLAATVVQDARMATVAERSRISREIHDNAGHDIIAAYISFQTLRNLIKDEAILEMYDATLERLSNGVSKIRDILHNLTPTETPGIEKLEKICHEFPEQITFKSYGNLANIPAYIWNTLAICLKESLTNASRHAKATEVKVEIDVGIHIIRLYVENDGVLDHDAPIGRGLTNLRYRVHAARGNLSVSKEKDKFKLICVIPLEKEVENHDKSTLS